MISRTIRIAGATALLSIAPASAAFAQYEEPTTTTRPTTTTTRTPTGTGAGQTTTSTTVETTTTTKAPPPNQVPAQVSTTTPAPGEPIQVTSPEIGNVPVFDREAPLVAGMTRTNPDGTIQTIALVPTLTFDPDGTARVTVQIPMGTPTDRIYTVFVVGTNPDGKTRTLVVDIVVRPPGRAPAGAEFVAAQKAFQLQAASPAVTVPAALRVIEPLTAAEEAEYVAAVLEDGADIRIEGKRLVLHRPDTGGDSARPLVAAAAVALASGAVVSIRRRPRKRRRA